MKGEFYNSLINHATNVTNHKLVSNIWEASKMNAMKDYHNLYLKVDVSLLACVFETFRKESLNSFELDSAHYLSTLAIVRMQC